MTTINSIDKYRIHAHRLKKSVKQGASDAAVSESVKQVLERFIQSGIMKSDSESVQLRRIRAFTLDKYLDLIAREEGHDDWASLAQCLKEQDKNLDDTQDTELYKLSVSEFNLNVWCPTYDDAKEYLDSHQGFYLLQYKGKCFLAQSPHIVGLGLDPKDPDWEKIGWDWVKPKDECAKTRLREKLHKARELAVS